MSTAATPTATPTTGMLRRTAAGLSALATGAAGLVALTAAPVAAAENPAAYIGDRGIVVASDRNVNVREPGERRQVVAQEGARVAYAAGERVVYETDRGVLTRDLENTNRLRAGAGVDTQRLLGVGEVGSTVVAVLEETRDPGPGDSYADFRSTLVAYDIIADTRTVLRGGYNGFESGYSTAHVLADGSVLAAGFSEITTSLERYAPDGTRVWGKRTGSDESVHVAVIGQRVSVLRNRSRGGDQVLRVVRLDPATGERQGARSVRVPDAASAPFCDDWRTPRRLLCRTVDGPVVVDAFGGRGIVNRIKAPSTAFVSVIGGR